MIRSMTGFGWGTAKIGRTEFRVEIRSLNHRYFDLSCRMPDALLAYEDQVRQQLQRTVRRGKVVVVVARSTARRTEPAPLIDRALAVRSVKELRRVQRELRLEGEIRLEHVLALAQAPAVREPEAIQHEQMWTPVSAALRRALAMVSKSREVEGRALARDLKLRIGKIGQCRTRIVRRSPAAVRKYKQRLKALAAEISKGVIQLDASRLEVEVANFARNCDITEELTRLAAHLDAFRGLLSGPREEVGRQMDFLAQEMQREVNTIGQKSQDAVIAESVIEAKSQIEKIREQVQNVE